LIYQAGYARTLYLDDDRKQARAAYSELLRLHPKCLDCVGAIGVLAARDHDRVVADSSVARLTSATLPYQFGRNLMWLARISAAFGDREGAALHLNSAFAAGAEFDVLTHADADLRSIKPDSAYRVFARVTPPGGQ
jgi:hypothetical protein